MQNQQSNLIIFKLKQLVASERKITTEIIEHIQLIDRNKIYLLIGYPSLYAFLTEHIGYTPASAQRRIEAARLLVAVPEVKEDLQLGTLNLSQVSLVAQSIRQKQKEEPAIKFNETDKKNLLNSVKGLSLEKSQKVITQTLDLEVKAFEKQKQQSDESVRIEMTLTKEQNEMLKKVKNLISHVNPSATVAEVFEYLAKDYLKRKDPMRVVNAKTIKNQSEQCSLNNPNKKSEKHCGTHKAIIASNTKNTSKSTNNKINLKEINHNSISLTNTKSTIESTSATEVINYTDTILIKNKTYETHANAYKKFKQKNRRALPVSIKRAVWKRDQGMCQHVNASTGKKCGSKHLLEFDHIKRYRHGGDNSVCNLQLLCRPHNLWKA